MKAQQTRSPKQHIDKESEHNSIEAQPIVTKKDVTDWEEKYKRVLADYHNLEQRTQTERTQLIKMANRWLIESLLEPLDFMKLATAHTKDSGIQMVVQKFNQALEEYGLTQVVVKEGSAFDEKTMEAIGTEPGKEGVVVKVSSSGYKLHELVIRHAKVIVGNGESTSKQIDET